jgi:2-iminobutanoate/2-iminopropanoate deaminase
MSARTPVSTPHAPAAIGPYAQAIRAGGLLFCSGQIALDPESGQFQNGSVAEQTVRVMENLKSVLAAGGSGFDRLVRCTVFLVDMNDFATVNEVYGRYFAGLVPPSRSTVAVAQLPRGARVEIDCIALA